MTDQPHGHLAVIRSLIEQAPDDAVHDLETALGGDMGGSALSGVRAMIDAEVADRAVRDIVFGPLKPLFGDRTDGIAQLTFPRPVYSALWHAVRRGAPQLVTWAAAATMGDPSEPPVEPMIYDDLCHWTAGALRARTASDFAALADRLDAAHPGAAERLAGCLDMTRIVRPALVQLPQWLHRMDQNHAATIRLAFKDAVAIDSDGGTRLFEIIFANLTEPWTVLRLISAVMARHVDNYISSSELAVFGERLLDDIDRRIAAIRQFDVDAGAAAGEAAGAHIQVLSAEIDEFDKSMHLGREGLWGARLAKQKTLLAKTVEGHLRKADDAVAAALPMMPLRVGGRVLRQIPRLDAPPDEALMRRATALLVLIERVRGPAITGGYNVVRTKALEEVEHRVNSYADDLLEIIHRGEGEDRGVARRYLDKVADMTGHIRDHQAAQLVRRRAAAA